MNDYEKDSIESHEEWPNVIDTIEKVGKMTKKELVLHLYDESGDGETKKYLNSLEKCTLLALVVDAIYGGTCQ